MGFFTKTFFLDIETEEETLLQQPIYRIELQNSYSPPDNDSEPHYLPSLSPPNSPIGHINPPVHHFDNEISNNELDQGNGLSRSDVNSLLIALSVRHKLTKAVNSRIDFLKFVSPSLPVSNSSKLLSSADESDATSYFFCRCMIPYSNRNQLCNTCGPLKNTFYVPELISQFTPILNRYGLVSGNVRSADLTIYTDGVNPFKNSEYCFWPIFFSVNQVPYNKRFSLENLIICGIFFGTFKPKIDILLDLSFRKHLFGFNNGFDVNGQVYKLNLKFLVADKPAKAETLCMTSSNSTHFCHACLKKKIRLQVNNTGSYYVFSPFDRDEVLQMRTKAGFLAMGHDASVTGRVNV